MSNSRINWRAFLFCIVTQVIATTKKREDKTTDKNIIKALILDDTPISKTGRKIEGVSRVFNHVLHRSILGFQLLVMGYYDGSMIIPINFSFHREKAKNKKKKYGLTSRYYKEQYKKKRDKKS